MHVRTLSSLSYEGARRVVDYVLSTARDGGRPIAVAVAGADGRLIAFAAMDGVMPVSIQYAIDKAYTSVVTERDTIAFPPNTAGRSFPDSRIVNFGGGVLLRLGSDGPVVGAIGVSGRRASVTDVASVGTTASLPQDHELGEAARNFFLREPNAQDGPETHA